MLKPFAAAVSIAVLALGLAAIGRVRRRQAGLRGPDEDPVEPVLGRDGEGRRRRGQEGRRRHLPAGGRVRPGGRAAAQRLQHDAAEEAGGDDHRGDQFDHPAALPQAGQRNEDPGRRPRQQPRSGDHQEGRRRNRLPHRLGQRGGGRQGGRLSGQRARQGRQGAGAGDRRPVGQHHRQEAGASDSPRS